MTYKEYLRTDHWQQLREAALARYGRQCAMCHARHRLNVHHTTYEKDGRSIWFREDLDDLIVLCKSCHETMHLAERINPLRFQITTELMRGGQHLNYEIPKGKFVPPPRSKPFPKLKSSKDMHLWTAEQRAAYKKARKQRLEEWVADRGQKVRDPILGTYRTKT